MDAIRGRFPKSVHDRGRNASPVRSQGTRTRYFHRGNSVDLADFDTKRIRCVVCNHATIIVVGMTKRRKAQSPPPFCVYSSCYSANPAAPADSVACATPLNISVPMARSRNCSIPNWNMEL